MAERKPVVAVTMGDPGGIGPELIVRALQDRSVHRFVRPLVIGDGGVLEHAVAGCGVKLKLTVVRSPEDVTGKPGLLELMDLANVPSHRFGVVDPLFGHASVQYIEQACGLARQGLVQGLVTGPISKEAIRAAGSEFPGHTEMLAALFDVPTAEVFTLFILDKLRIFFLTRHYSLRQALEQLTEEAVVKALVRIQELAREIGISAPRLAVAALNPHAGENGLLGYEELDILRPAVARGRSYGIDVVGPIPADAVFYQCRQGRFDAVLALYHDQGHIAAKTVDFFGTVSCTLGLPVIRTSVDHGTAFDIAGRWIAEARGEVAALKLAGQLAPRVLAARHAISVRQS